MKVPRPFQRTTVRLSLVAGVLVGGGVAVTLGVNTSTAQSHQLSATASTMVTTTTSTAVTATTSTAIVTTSTTVVTAPGPVPPLSENIVDALDHTGVTVSPLSQSEIAASGFAGTPAAFQDATSAALAELPLGSTVSAASLVTLAGAPGLGGPTTVLAWAIQTVPAGGYMTASAGPAGVDEQGRLVPNYEIDFVNAATGRWIMSTQGGTH